MRNQIKCKSWLMRLSIIPTLVLILVFSGCDPVDGLEEETLQELNLRKLSEKPWSLGEGAGSIVVDGTDVSANYQGFSLTYADGSYTTTNGAELFQARGTWEWIDEQASMIRLDDGKELTIVSLTDVRLTFTFNFSEGGARAGIPGNYTVSVVK
jgi:hypothetical protein